MKLPKEDREWRQLVEQVTSGTDDRSTVVLAGAVVDAVLAELLTSWLLPDEAVEGFFDPLREGFLSTFGARKDLAFALGLVSDDERKDLQAIGRVRNIFAHQLLNATFDHPDVQKALSGLRSVQGLTPKSEPRERFRRTIMQFVVSLRMFRTLEPTTAAKFRRRVERRVATDWRTYVRGHYKRKKPSER